jgi:hypothetical protein
VLAHESRPLRVWLIFDVRQKMKRCLKISDRVGVRELVEFLGARGRDSEWHAHDVWTVQEGDDCRFAKLCEQKSRIAGAEFVSSLRRVTQVIDGRFEAFDHHALEPWVVIESIDSSFHLLHADEPLATEAQKQFASVAEIPTPAVPWRRRSQAQ